MVRAVREYFERTGVYVGFKPAGGIRTAKEALLWLSLMKEELGRAWLEPELFRLERAAFWEILSGSWSITRLGVTRRCTGSRWHKGVNDNDDGQRDF